MRQKGVCRSVVGRLIAKFSDSEPTVTTSDRGVTVESEDGCIRLTRGAAVALAGALAAVGHREFLHTACEHRTDGSYVVERRGAESAGHRKVFDSFGAARRLYERLPGEFTAEDLTRAGLTDGRRHLLVRHFAEHPAFDCTLVRRQPLTASKRGDGGGDKA